jgi:fermentation-respiration switch protein FrsA (DUF1100 family)
MNRFARRGLRLLRSLVIAAVSALIIWTIVLMLFEENFIYFPQKYPQGAYDQARSIPNLRDCWIMTEDSVKIHAWFAAADSAKATLVLSHGNAGNISHRYLLLRALQRHGFNVLMYDYRGYGRSEGSPTEAGIYKDGLAAYDYAVALPEAKAAPVLLWGTSLGGAVAIDIATRRPSTGLILESTFTSARDVARVVYPFLPVQFFMHTRLNSIEKIKTLTIPILVIHGAHDSIIPIGLGRKLFNAANQPKDFYEIPNADHNDTFFMGGEEYFFRVDRFIASLSHPS